MDISHAMSQLDGMKAVEELVDNRCQSDFPLLREIPEYLFRLGGKRLRPALTLAAGRAFGLTSPTQELIEIAAGIELIHMATLLHDDIIDKSPLRRKHPSPYLKYGLASTLLSGDFLLVRAFGLCSRLPQPVIAATEQACVELTEGEIEEIAVPLARHTIESSMRIATKKTASLFRLATFSAAYLAGLSEDQLQASAAFGEKLGIAFQILDDILDVTSSHQELGKQPGLDIKERKPSYVNLCWLLSSSSLAQRLLTEEDLDEVYIEAALSELRESQVIEQSRQAAKALALEASGYLDEVVARPNLFEASGEMMLLRKLVQFTVERVS
jgi:geranylgeranyl pyrophosphate synthase